MKPLPLTLILSGLALGAALPVLAQQEQPETEAESGEIAQSGQREQFRTFEPSEGDLAYFADSAMLTQESGEAIYNAVCSGCHMPEGQGAVGAGMYPALAENEMLEFPEYPIYLIVNGQKAMPPLGGILSDEQVAEVTNYIRSHFGNDYVEGENGIAATAEDVAAVRP
ncbi:c-type cytochrome [Limimaricola pyoseonensis]|uniref:Cytochrome C oxidase, cbb3-type, subunit III n=1 Tax=Limimaricola pyoseonensis TaxID=521013 RepID=A0A1G7L384_9RHOB|nr:cytochrome c [Limimaricola pyoseonensis]SDF44012.1 Cytochrome C oxidase, cbb3-type, subunit III [Limimaricola pyoseonensis]